MELAIFIIMALVSVISALLVITRRNAVISAIYLIVTLCSMAILFLLLNAVFLAVIQIIVYAGAIMVLFLFVIMLLNLRRDEFGSDRKKLQRIFAVLFAIFLLVEIGIITKVSLSESWEFSTAEVEATQFGGVKALGKLLFTDFLFPFELTSILLLVAMVGAIVLAKRRL